MPPFATPARVFTRAASARYPGCLRADATARIDLYLARAQHAGYVATLRALGIVVDVLPTDDACPDACFVEDTAVITGTHAVATHPGAPSRRAEVEPVARVLARHLTVHPMATPATLEVVQLSVRGGLHLKSACSLASASLLLYDPDLMGDAELSPLRACGVEVAPVSEPAGSNVLAVGAAVLVSAAAPGTAGALRARGLDVRVVDVGEFHKGDGALTCLSLRVPAAGAWAT